MVLWSTRKSLVAELPTGAASYCSMLELAEGERRLLVHGPAKVGLPMQTRECDRPSLRCQSFAGVVALVGSALTLELMQMYTAVLRKVEEAAQRQLGNCCRERWNSTKARTGHDLG